MCSNTRMCIAIDIGMFMQGISRVLEHVDVLACEYMNLFGMSKYTHVCIQICHGWVCILSMLRV